MTATILPLTPRSHAPAPAQAPRPTAPSRMPPPAKPNRQRIPVRFHALPGFHFRRDLVAANDLPLEPIYA